MFLLWLIKLSSVKKAFVFVISTCSNQLTSAALSFLSDNMLDLLFLINWGRFNCKFTLHNFSPDFPLANSFWRKLQTTGKSELNSYLWGVQRHSPRDSPMYPRILRDIWQPKYLNQYPVVLKVLWPGCDWQWPTANQGARHEARGTRNITLTTSAGTRKFFSFSSLYFHCKSAQTTSITRFLQTSTVEE